MDKNSRTQDLLDAMDAAARYQDGELPTAEELEAAPLLTDWIVQPMPGVAGVYMLAGDCVGHPLLGNQWITTSPLIHLAKDQTFARTRSRLYRLGAVHPMLRTGDQQ